jgi:cysteine synthase B
MTFPTIDSFVGNTPLVRLQRLPGTTSNTILVKLEGNNPAGSVKDRPAHSMINNAEQRGEIQPGDRLIEATSGNTGIALAMAAAIKGYKMTLIMPDNMSEERRASMKAYDAEIILTPAEGSIWRRQLIWPERWKLRVKVGFWISFPIQIVHAPIIKARGLKSGVVRRGK